MCVAEGKGTRAFWPPAAASRCPMRQRVFVVVLCHFGLALVSLPSFRSRKASRESNKREREREGEPSRERYNYCLSCALSLLLRSLSLSLSWPGFVSAPLAQCRLLADCRRNMANTAHVDRVCRRLINVTLCHSRS